MGQCEYTIKSKNECKKRSESKISLSTLIYLVMAWWGQEKEGTTKLMTKGYGWKVKACEWGQKKEEAQDIVFGLQEIDIEAMLNEVVHLHFRD